MTLPVIPHHSPTGGTWQVIGDLILDPASPSPNLPDDWFRKTLQPFGLPANLLENVNRSACQALEHFQLEAGAQPVPPIHLRVFIPAILPIDGANWGYFHMQKSGAIEFYLYPEG